VTGCSVRLPASPTATLAPFKSPLPTSFMARCASPALRDRANSSRHTQVWWPDKSANCCRQSCWPFAKRSSD
jgi:hypothetical protein